MLRNGLTKTKLNKTNNLIKLRHSWKFMAKMAFIFLVSLMLRLVPFPKLASRYFKSTFDNFFFLMYLQIKQNVKCPTQSIHHHEVEIPDNFSSFNNEVEIGEKYKMK